MNVTEELQNSVKLADNANDNFDYDYEPIEAGFENGVEKQSIAEQYFELRFCSEDNEDFCILFHSNRICLVTLAKSHSIVRENKKIEKVEFKKPVGAKKNNVLQPKTIVCMIECTDKSMYKVRALITGKLMEVNENLISNPSLLVKEPTEDGYLFIILPSIPNYEDFKNKYMSLTEYNKKLAQEQSQ